MTDTVFFSGTSNRPLADAIARKLDTTSGNIEITRFIDNECRVYVKEDVSGKKVAVLQSLSQIADQNLIELCLIGQALKSLDAKHITAVIPWLGYSKQDKEFRHGEAVSAQLVAKFIQAAGFDEIISVELHSEKVVPFFKIPMTEISSSQLFADYLKKRIKDKNMAVVSPDRGGVSRSEGFAGKINLPIVYLEKERNLETGKVEIKSISEPVEKRGIVIFDDIINTGETAVKAARYLKKQNCEDIYFLATHAVLAGDAAVKLNESPIDKIVVTDTIFIPEEKRLPKFEVLSVYSLLSDAILAASR